jgi:hypothetical protein
MIASVAEVIAQERAASATDRQIANLLTASGILSRSGTRTWTVEDMQREAPSVRRAARPGAATSSSG